MSARMVSRMRLIVSLPTRCLSNIDSSGVHRLLHGGLAFGDLRLCIERIAGRQLRRVPGRHRWDLIPARGSDQVLGAERRGAVGGG